MVDFNVVRMLRVAEHMNVVEYNGWKRKVIGLLREVVRTQPVCD
jgi:hypothetical protein